MKYRRRKGIKGLILALATAAILVPAASAKTYEGGSAGYVEVASAKAQGYTPQALKAMSERYARMADYYQHSYTPQALKAMNDRLNLQAQAYEQSQEAAGAAGGSNGGLYPGSGAGPGSTVTASTRPDDRAGIHGVGTTTTQSDYVDRQLANLVAKAKLVAQSYHVDDRAGIRGPGPIETPTVISVHSDGFDWTDAGIGASAALLAALMLVAATALMRRRSTGLAV
jgi:hypothetical protein